MLTVTTLAFALATQAWLLPQSWALKGGLEPRPPKIAGHVLSSGKSYYYFGAALLAVAVAIAHNVRRSGFGRLLVAVRDNEDAARAFTVRASLVKMQGYMLSGFLAGIGGAVFGYSLSRIDHTAFPALASIDVVVMAVLGGISLISGPILGAIYVLGIPAFIPLDNAGLAATQFGALLLILWAPRGLGSLVTGIRDALVNMIGRLAGIELEATPADAPSPNPASFSTPIGPRHAMVRGPDDLPDLADGLRGALLTAGHLRKSFGGVVAVSDVSLSVNRGETVGLIGPNGAGKTTTFELLSGFTPADEGSVLFDGRDVTWYPPEARARLGMVRSFQDAALFPTMTVGEVVAVALEGSLPAPFLSSVIGYSPTERERRERAKDIVGFFGLTGYRDRSIQELSTGTRRIVEIACLIAAQPKLLLLDEPSSGVAQRETEALGGLLVDLKAQFGLTMIVIEHDIPLIMGISDRIIAMADGRVIASGAPDAVSRDADVVEAYLGGDIRSIERSAGRKAVAVERGKR
jgi:ABC-type branched-subunit amino acid transport system ATPase component